MDGVQRRAAAKRQQIVDAAREVFLEQGFAGSSMDAIVAHAGVSKQTAYRYFPSKTDLLAAVLASEMEETGFFAGPPPRLRTVAELRGLLVAIARAITNQMMQPRRIALLRLAFGEAFRIPELRDNLREVLPGTFFDRMHALLRLATAQGLIRSDRPEIDARLYIGSVISYVTLGGILRADPLPPPPDADLEHLVDAFLRAVAVPEAVAMIQASAASSQESEEVGARAADDLETGPAERPATRPAG